MRRVSPRWLRILGPLMAGMFLLGGCATGPATLQLAADTTAPRTPEPRGPAVSPVIIEALQDCRPHGDTLGVVGGREFHAKEPAKWIEQELRAMSSPRFVCITDTHDSRPLLTLRPRLLKAYVNSVDVAKIAAVVIEVDYVECDGATQTRMYRGQLTGANWASTESEVENALRNALKRCLVQMKNDIETQLSLISHVP